MLSRADDHGYYGSANRGAARLRVSAGPEGQHADDHGINEKNREGTGEVSIMKRGLALIVALLVDGEVWAVTVNE